MTKCERLLFLAALAFMAALCIFSRRGGSAFTVESVSYRPAAEPTPEVSVVLREQVDLNSDPITALTVLPGVGETLAARIVSWRETNGPFSSVEDLRYVEGVGDATLSKIYAKMEEP